MSLTRNSLLHRWRRTEDPSAPTMPLEQHWISHRPSGNSSFYSFHFTDGKAKNQHTLIYAQGHTTKKQQDMSPIFLYFEANSLDHTL